MSNVRILQVLCGPALHCIVAMAYEPDAHLTPEYVLSLMRQRVRKMLDAKEFDPCCGLCKSPEPMWRYDDMPTRFKTMEEAKPELERLQAAQVATWSVARMTKRPQARS